MPQKNLPEILDELYEDLFRASTVKPVDKATVVRCVEDLQAALKLSGRKLADLLGVSDQTVLRWKLLEGPYAKTVPSLLILKRLEEVIHTFLPLITLPMTKEMPRNLSAAHVAAVATLKNPRAQHFILLHWIEQILGGVTLGEDTCKAILRDLEAAEGPKTT